MPSTKPWPLSATSSSPLLNKELELTVYENAMGMTQTLVARCEVSMREIIASRGGIVDSAVSHLTQHLVNAVEQEIERGLKDIIREAVIAEVKEQVKQQVADRIDELIEALV